MSNDVRLFPILQDAPFRCLGILHCVPQAAGLQLPVLNGSRALGTEGELQEQGAPCRPLALAIAMCRCRVRCKGTRRVWSPSSLPAGGQKKIAGGRTIGKDHCVLELLRVKHREI